VRTTDLRRGLLVGVLAFLTVACSTATPTASPSALASPPAPTPGAPAGSGPTGANATAEPGTTAEPGASQEPATAAPTTQTSATPGEPSPAETPIAGLDQLVGTDGRFTMLLLGSDARAGLGGERTDTIMIATIDPANGKVAFVSLPRDTDQVPIGPGQTYGPKINGLFQQYHVNSGNRKSAYRSMVKALEYTFGIEIDRYALLHFDGLVSIIDQMGGIDVRLAQPFDDATSHVSKRGLHLHMGRNHLDGRYALAFSRSRHTTSDYDRARRQQLVIATAVTKVLGMGIGELAGLAPAAFSKIETDLKIGDAPALFGLAQKARLEKYRSAVLGPRTYATESAGFSNQLKLGVVRALFHRIFGG
jgi:polyisoprenyl-teichoic acid--peptidoglycan teichoic acid transferase